MMDYMLGFCWGIITLSMILNLFEKATTAYKNGFKDGKESIK